MPLLLLVARFPHRPAMATSLAAIGGTALAGVAAYSFTGRVDVLHAALVGIPAAAGAIAGSALQQRLPTRGLALGFAALLTAVAAMLLLG